LDRVGYGCATGDAAVFLWGAHAPRVLAMAPSPSRTFPSESIAARRRNGHARRVRYPEFFPRAE